MSISVDPRVGTELAGYRIERLLGRGGMGVVYLAEDLRLKRRVALKLVAPELAADERFRERFLRESELAASIDHSHIIPIYEAGEADGLLYIAMRYVEGTDLRALLEREGALEPRRALTLLGQVAEALDTAHDHSLVHRDVKPANILIASEGGREHCYLSDFGLSKGLVSESGPAEAATLSGTADYVAPEQITREPVDARADVYSLGCVLYECLTGATPFAGNRLMGVLWAHVTEPPPPASERRPDLPAGFDDVVAKALAKSPEERYPSCGELVEAAREELGLAGMLAPPPLTRRRLFLLVGIALVFIAAAAAAAAVLLGRGGGSGAAAVPPVQVDSLVRIDPETNRVAATIAVDADPSAVAVGEGSVWVASYGDRVISRIDPKTNIVTSRYDANAGLPFSLAAGEGAVWAGYAQPWSVQRLDPRTGSFSPVVSGVQTGGLAVGEGAVWSADVCFGRVLRIDPETTDTVVIVPEPARLRCALLVAVGEGGVWVVSIPSNQSSTERGTSLSRIDPVRNEVGATVDLPFQPGDIAIGEGAVWLTNTRNDSVVRIDPLSLRVTDTVAVGSGISGIAVGEGSVWVGEGSDATVSRIDPKTREVVATIEVGGKPRDLEVGLGGVWLTVEPAR